MRNGSRFLFRGSCCGAAVACWVVVFAWGGVAEAQRGRIIRNPFRRAAPQNIQPATEVPLPVPPRTEQFPPTKTEEAPPQSDSLLEDGTMPEDVIQPDEDVTQDARFRLDVEFSEAENTDDPKETGPDAPGPDEEDDFVAEKPVVESFEMEGAEKVSEAELEKSLRLPADATAEDVAQFLLSVESLEPDADFVGGPEATRRFMSKIAAAKWDAASRMLGMNDLPEEMLPVAVETLLGVAFFLPETYGEKVKTLPEALRKRGMKRQAWKAEEGLTQLETSVLLKDETRSEAEKRGLLAKTCDTLISHLEKGLAEELANDDDVLTLAVMLITYGETLGPENKARLFYRFAPTAKKRDDPQLLMFGTLLENAAARLKSEGKPLDFTLRTASLKTLTPKDYTGKTLLLYFWSPENDISLREIPILLDIYRFYHPKGLEVIGIALGGGSVLLDDVLENGDLPWETVIDHTGSEPEDEPEDEADGESDGKIASHEDYTDAPAVSLGVLECPMMILVGPDGNVLSAEMTLLQLLAALEKTYGDFQPAAEEE